MSCWFSCLLLYHSGTMVGGVSAFMREFPFRRENSPWLVVVSTGANMQLLDAASVHDCIQEGKRFASSEDIHHVATEEAGSCCCTMHHSCETSLWWIPEIIF